MSRRSYVALGAFIIALLKIVVAIIITVLV